MRTIGVVTVARSDYGIYLPLLRAIQADPELTLHLIASGMHLSPEFGLTVRQIKADGFPIGERVEMLLSSDTPEGVAKSMGLGVIGFAQAYAHYRPDILVVLGDRFEMHAAALAALPFKLPVAHIHGGELTLGAIDDALRHSITKLSHLHFVSTQEYARRVIQMGEDPWRVVVSGALSLDNLQDVQLLDREHFATKFGIALPPDFLLVTYHPVTLEYEQTEWQIGELLVALHEVGLPILFTMPNADTGGRVIRQKIAAYVASNADSFAVENLGIQGYFSVMALASAMVGNSSSGIIEAASFKLPVVNIGTRQSGRVRGINVIDANYHFKDIMTGIEHTLSPDFLRIINQLKNPYGSGDATKTIIGKLKTTSLNKMIILKQYCDLQFTVSEAHEP